MSSYYFKTFIWIWWKIYFWEKGFPHAFQDGVQVNSRKGQMVGTEVRKKTHYIFLKSLNIITWKLQNLPFFYRQTLQVTNLAEISHENQFS